MTPPRFYGRVALREPSFLRVKAKCHLKSFQCTPRLDPILRLVENAGAPALPFSAQSFPPPSAPPPSFPIRASFDAFRAATAVDACRGRGRERGRWWRRRRRQW